MRRATKRRTSLSCTGPLFKRPELQRQRLMSGWSGLDGFHLLFKRTLFRRWSKKPEFANETGQDGFAPTCCAPQEEDPVGARSRCPSVCIL